MKSLDQAKKIYELLIKATEPLTYRQVLFSLGYSKKSPRNSINFWLELIFLACADKGLPILSSLVVNQSTGKPRKSEIDPRVLDYKEWPDVNEINWDYIWKNRKQLAALYSIPRYSGTDKKISKEINKILGHMKCPKNFACARNGFNNLCRAKECGMEQYLECLDENPLTCRFVIVFGNQRFCQCPLRVYIAKYLDK